MFFSPTKLNCNQSTEVPNELYFQWKQYKMILVSNEINKFKWNYNFAKINIKHLIFNKKCIYRIRYKTLRSSLSLQNYLTAWYIRTVLFNIVYKILNCFCSKSFFAIKSFYTSLKNITAELTAEIHHTKISATNAQKPKKRTHVIFH